MTATSYVPSGGTDIAYQLHGSGPIDIVVVPGFLSNVEIIWEQIEAAQMFDGLAAFARLIVFDRRGSGLSGGLPGMASLEEQVSDVLAVMDAVQSEAPVLYGHVEGAALSVLFAAAHPERVRALVMLEPLLCAVRRPGYEFAHTAEERRGFVDRLVTWWGSEDPRNPFSAFAHDDAEARRQLARFQRHCLNPGAARAALDLVGRIDVRDAVPTVQCPTLVVRWMDGTAFVPGHARYAADHLPGAQLLELPGAAAPWHGSVQLLEAIERFITGARRPVVSERVLTTVLFTDIVASTERAAALGDRAWREVLERHDAVVRGAIRRQGGTLVKSLGDGALATFEGPSRGVAAAIEIRERVSPLGLSLRAGVHTGECERVGSDIGGLAVHLGSRISSVAEPGEVLVSRTVRDLTAGSGLQLRDRGEHELKGLPGMWRLYAVEG